MITYGKFVFLIHYIKMFTDNTNASCPFTCSWNFWKQKVYSETKERLYCILSANDSFRWKITILIYQWAALLFSSQCVSTPQKTLKSRRSNQVYRRILHCQEMYFVICLALSHPGNSQPPSLGRSNYWSHQPMK